MIFVFNRSLLDIQNQAGIVMQLNENLIVTIQPPPNQLDNIDFDVIGTSDY